MSKEARLDRCTQSCQCERLSNCTIDESKKKLTVIEAHSDSTPCGKMENSKHPTNEFLNKSNLSYTSKNLFEDPKKEVEMVKNNPDACKFNSPDQVIVLDKKDSKITNIPEYMVKELTEEEVHLVKVSFGLY